MFYFPNNLSCNRGICHKAFQSSTIILCSQLAYSPHPIRATICCQRCTALLIYHNLFANRSRDVGYGREQNGMDGRKKEKWSAGMLPHTGVSGNSQTLLSFGLLPIQSSVRCKLQIKILKYRQSVRFHFLFNTHQKRIIHGQKCLPFP